MFKKIQASVLYPSQCFLGEGPVWVAERKSCLWVDIENCMLYEYNWLKKSVKSWRFDYKTALVLPGNNGCLILGLNRSVARFNPETEKLEWLVNVESELTENRFNDGGCDSRGRLWIGSMDMGFKEGAGSLYCIDEQLQVHKKLDKVSISNGLVWSLDNTRLYYIDSPTQVVKSFIFNEDSGEINFEKNVIVIPKKFGTPDGMAIDEEGMLWIAHWGGFGVYRWNPLNGKLIDKIEVPAPNVTSCAFAGENLDHLVITTARQDMSKNELFKYPGSGDVFYAKTLVRGVQQNKCIF